jgi:NAD(P)-dependent dehydrogenase (short-subunit alcohol dehydrogenase family)
MAEETLPPQQQDEPGHEHLMQPKPETAPRHPGNGRLKDKVAIITGGDSGIGRAVALAFANEGADVAIAYLEEHKDAEDTRRGVERYGRRCLLFGGDVREVEFCRYVVEKTVRELGHLNIVVNNAAEQHPQEEFEKISPEQLDKTFQTNIYGYFHLTRVALPHLHEGDSIINTTSVTAYKGSPQLIDYSSTKGAIVAYTRSLSMHLAEKGIRVNAVAPGPIWTPLIPSTFGNEKVTQFGSDVPMGRPGQPNEVAPSFVFLACDDASYMSGQVLHPNGGTVVNG